MFLHFSACTGTPTYNDTHTEPTVCARTVHPTELTEWSLRLRPQMQLFPAPPSDIPRGLRRTDLCPLMPHASKPLLQKCARGEKSTGLSLLLAGCSTHALGSRWAGARPPSKHHGMGSLSPPAQGLKCSFASCCTMSLFCFPPPGVCLPPACWG